MDDIMCTAIRTHDTKLFNATATTNSTGSAISTHGKFGKWAISVIKNAGAAFNLDFSILVERADGTYVTSSTFDTITFTDADYQEFEIPVCTSFKPYIVGNASNGADSNATVHLYYLENY